MKSELRRLIALSDAHVGHYEELFDVVLRERRAIIAQDLEGLAETMRAKEKVVRAISASAEALSGLVEILFQRIGRLPDESSTLSDLAARLPAPWSGELKRRTLALTRLRKSIERDNRANQAFLKEALDLVSGAISILSGANAPPTTGYGAAGRKQSAAAPPPTRFSREV